MNKHSTRHVYKAYLPKMYRKGKKVKSLIVLSAMKVDTKIAALYFLVTSLNDSLSKKVVVT